VDGKFHYKYEASILLIVSHAGLEGSDLITFKIESIFGREHAAAVVEGAHKY
jgi:hypothetical protein